MYIFSTQISVIHIALMSRGSDGQVGFSYFFTLDIEGNILKSDEERHVISVFTS